MADRVSPEQKRITREIAAPADTVFTALNDPETMRKFVPRCTAARWSHPEGQTGLGVGSVRHFTVPPGLTISEELLAYEPGKSLVYRIVGGPVPIGAVLRNYRGVTMVKPLGPGRCRLEWTLHYTPRALAGPLVPIMARFLEDQVAAMADRLADLCAPPA